MVDRRDANGDGSRCTKKVYKSIITRQQNILSGKNIQILLFYQQFSFYANGTGMPNALKSSP
jgi:hypothetical protein